MLSPSPCSSSSLLQLSCPYQLDPSSTHQLLKPAAIMALNISRRAAFKPVASADRHVVAAARPRTALPQQHGLSESSQPAMDVTQRLTAGLATAMTVMALAVAPPSYAVSGGGGLSGPISDLDFSGQDLRKNKYTKAIMRKTNFSNTKLTGVSLFGAVATGANFHGADLTNADLESGDFMGADFSDAVLVGAYANNAQFQDANIKGSDWTDVQLRRDVQKYLCTLAEGTNPVTGVDTRESLMCP